METTNGLRTKMSQSYVFSDDIVSLVLGPNDKNLPYMELLLGTDLTVKGNMLISDTTKDYFPMFFSRLELCAKERGVLSESEIFMVFDLLDRNDDVFSSFSSCNNEISTISVMSRTIWPKSNGQRKLIESLRSNQVVFASGPAGTGKTFLAIAWSLQEVLSGRKNKIVMTRPVVEAGESLGFLPGDLAQKINPYLRPLYDAMEYLIPHQHIKRLEENGSIEIAPLAYMRGRSLNDAMIILDEAQNTTSLQMRMFLTRLGDNSQAIITGDPSQIDLDRKKDSGLVDAMSILSGIEGISMVEFSHLDIVRSRIVREIAKAYSHERDICGGH